MIQYFVLDGSFVVNCSVETLVNESMDPFPFIPLVYISIHLITTVHVRLVHTQLVQEALISPLIKHA